jgi:hypothetical protein
MDHEYSRVIPRDLFNEANLLKCYGQLYLELERYHVDADLILIEPEQPFQVGQNPSDGSLSIINVIFTFRGQTIPLHRPLNSREAWPLYATLPGDREISVFDSSGYLSAELYIFVKAEADAQA